MVKFFYKAYYRFGNSRFWVQKRVTPAGSVVFLFLLFSAFTGLDVYRTIIYQVFSLVCAIFIISWFFSQFLPPKNIRARRVISHYGSVGKSFKYRIIIKNSSQRNQKGLLVIENPGDARPTFSEFLRMREPGEEKRNWWDRHVYAHRWFWITYMKNPFYAREQSIPTIQPGSEYEITASILPLRRGYIQLDSLHILKPDPLGLTRSGLKCKSYDRILILPKIYDIPSPNIPGLRKYQPGGVALASSVGNSGEFFSLRDYRPGDPLRHIHWKSWAKARKPVVKEYQDEYFVRHALILDTFIPERDKNNTVSSSLDEELVFEEAVNVTASFAAVSHTIQDSLMDLMFIDDRIYNFTSGRGVSHTEEMLEILSSVKAVNAEDSEKGKDLQSLASSVISKIPTLSSCICVFLCWDQVRKDFIMELQSWGIFMQSYIIAKNDADKASLEREIKDASGISVLRVGKIEEDLTRALQKLSRD